MAIAAPPEDRFATDLIDRVLDQANPDGALDAILGAYTTREGRNELTSTLMRRLGELEDRIRLTRELAEQLPEEQPLVKSLFGMLTLPEIEEAAEEMVRVLGVAIGSGTSDHLIRNGARVLHSALTDQKPAPPAPPVRVTRSEPDEVVTPREVESPALPEKRPPPSAPTARPKPYVAPPAYDPNGPFRIPDKVVRFGEEGRMLAAPLLPVSGGAQGGGPVRVPAALPAPPETDDPDLIRGWLRGVPAFSDALGVRAGSLETGDPGDLMEIEAEFHADPKAALRLYKASRPIPDGTAGAAWCARLGRDVGRFGVTHERAVATLVDALREQMRDGPGELYAPLSRGGAILIVQEELAEAVCGLIDVEADYLEDGPADTSGPDQNLLGAFSPTCDLSRGRCLERALILHRVAQLPMGEAMRQSLTEFRIAQALRANPAAPIDALNRRFDLDAALPLSELSGHAAIVRIGLTEPALV